MKKEKDLIQVQSPFDKLYDLGYTFIDSAGREYIKLKEINSNLFTKRMSYPRYVVSVSLNRLLANDEKVYHIDRNPLNNTIENLRIVTTGNIQEEEKNIINIQNIQSKKNELIDAICSFCLKPYKRKSKIVYKHTFCSVNCQHQFYRKSSNFYNKTISFTKRKLNG